MGITYIMQWDGKSAGLYAGLIGLVGLLNELLRLNNKNINALYLKLVKPFARKEEINKFSGLTYYAFGVAVTFYFFSWDLANLAIWYLIFGDPIGALFGKIFGKRKITENKSWVGCLSFYITCLIVTIIYLNLTESSRQQNIVFIFTAPLIGAVSEFLVIKDDNLSIPIISASGLTLLELGLL